MLGILPRETYRQNTLTSYSLFILSNSCIMFSEILKSVNNNLSIKGFTLSIKPSCFALLITPKVPVYLI